MRPPCPRPYPWALLLACLATPALAQSRVVPVAEQAEPAHGVRAGGFLVIPRFHLDEGFRGNIYEVARNAKHDRVTRLRPGVSVQSDWNRHALNMLAVADMRRYARYSHEDTNDYTLAVDGRLDVVHDTSIGGGLAWRRQHEERGDPNSPNSLLEPQRFETTTAKIGAYRGRGRLNARLDSVVEARRYADMLTTGGGLVRGGPRNYTAYTQSLRMGYHVRPDFEVYGKGSVDSRVYSEHPDLNRNSHGQRYIAGIAFDITGKTHGDFYAGLMRRGYTDATLAPMNEPTYGAKLVWNVDGMTSVLATVERRLEETTLAGASGDVASTYALEVQHMLGGRLVARGRLGLDVDQYKGYANQRRDRTWEGRIGLDYYLNRFAKTGLTIAHRWRTSNVPDGGYDDTLVLLSLGLSY